ncbi:hypothetical protein RCG19_10570 [Neobacillus sp. OS1-2]|uniref:hypothetical protein n=1 Tax=Neobacillus sp. OS1-2 TaxID=3070680 RepID=UPI0027E1BBCE|nr:hypothetical protein [Neobacillus sp. OS1-2]WML42020.1 hypothetical protein RCG19_10570 [Neobacillus sp. OS1-2]
MKTLLNIIITILVLVGLCYGITYLTHTKFIDYSFVIGMAATIIIWFSTSKGGLTSRNTDMIIQGTTGIKMEGQKFEFSPNIAFFTSLAYTILTFAAMLYHYRSYL